MKSVCGRDTFYFVNFKEKVFIAKTLRKDSKVVKIWWIHHCALTMISTTQRCVQFKISSDLSVL